MGKVRFLQSTFVPLFDRVFHHNEEHPIEDESLVNLLIERKLVEKVPEKAPKAPKSAPEAPKSASEAAK